jgi:hypothetical protein
MGKELHVQAIEQDPERTLGEEIWSFFLVFTVLSGFGKVYSTDGESLDPVVTILRAANTTDLVQPTGEEQMVHG